MKYCPASMERGGFRLGYEPGLDGLRGLLVVMIMVFHSFVLWSRLYGRAVPGAYITLNMFFVLSGFLITSLLLTEHTGTDAVVVVVLRPARVAAAARTRGQAARVPRSTSGVMYRDLLGQSVAALGWIST